MQRERLETIEDELEDVKRRLGRIWHFIEAADNVEMIDASDRIRKHRIGRSVLRMRPLGQDDLGLV